MDKQMEKAVAEFVGRVKDTKLGHNEISGRVLHAIVKDFGGPDELGESETADAVRKTMAFLGDTSAKGYMSQDQAELLLDPPGKSVPTEDQA